LLFWLAVKRCKKTRTLVYKCKRAACDAWKEVDSAIHGSGTLYTVPLFSGFGH